MAEKGKRMRGDVGLEKPGNNVTKVWLGSVTALFSYETLVAVWVRGEGEVKRYVSRGPHSPTTQKHVNQHGPARFVAEGEHLERVTPDELAAIVARVTGVEG